MKYVIFGAIFLLGGCGPSLYPSLSTVPEVLDVSKNLEECAKNQDEMQAVPYE
jgi:hypothetical protein